MDKKYTDAFLVAVIILLIGVIAYLIFLDKIFVKAPPAVSYEFVSPTSGEEWQVGKEYVIKWLPVGANTISLSIINQGIGENYRFHICSPVPPYPCELPDTGEFRFAVPPDDGHNEWAQSSDYQIALYSGSGIAGTSEKFSITSQDEIVKPPAPGPFVADAVRNLMPKALKVGQNNITAEVRGYMFFEGETHLALYDGLKEVDIGARSDGLPNTVVFTSGDWMTLDYVPIDHTITIPAELKGKTLVIRFIDNEPVEDAKPKYWGTLIKVE